MMRLSLDELAERVGMRPRTVRSYIEKGLLPGPGTTGRYASYGPHHLERLQAIKVLREIDGLSLEETRRRLVALGEAEIRDIAARLEAWRKRPEADLARDLAEAFDAEAPRLREPSAAHRDKALRPKFDAFLADEGDAVVAPASIVRAVSAPSRRRERLLQTPREEAVSADERVPRRSRAEPMTRIEITPDIDLVVRGVHQEHQLRRLERIADYVRDALLGPKDE